MRIPIVLGTLALAALACELSGSAVPSPEPGATPPAETPLVLQEAVGTATELTAAFPPDSGEAAVEHGPFGMESIGAGLEALDSYRLAATLRFEGVDATGAPVVWSLASERIVTSQPPASRFDLAAGGAAASSSLSEMTVVHAGEASFLAMPGIGCVSGAAADVAATTGGLSDPDTLMTGLNGARWVADGQLVNGVVSRHYQFDRQALPALRDRPLEVSGDLFVAEELGYVTRLTMTASGANDFLAPGNVQEGTLTLELNVSDANRPLIVQLPEECTGGEAYPLVADAFEITNLGDLVSYKTHQSLGEVVTFYQERMPAAGWSPVGEAEIFADSAILTFAQGDAVVTVNVDPDPQAGAVIVLISP